MLISCVDLCWTNCNLIQGHKSCLYALYYLLSTIFNDLVVTIVICPLQIQSSKILGILAGYVPSVEKIIQSSVTMLHHAMNAVVKQILETTPPCAKTEVYFGPEGKRCTHSMISN